MFAVSNVIEDAKRIFGTDAAEEYLLSRVNHGIQVLSNKGQWDSLLTYIDVLCVGRCASIPSDVDTVLAASIDGFPALGRDRLFQWHLNGPGERWSPGRYEWIDDGIWPVARQPECATKLVVNITDSRDANAVVRIWADDEKGRPVTSIDASGNTVPWWQPPVTYPYAVLDPAAVKISRINRAEKPITRGRIQLRTVDYGNSPAGPTGTLLADWGPLETLPEYRRMQLSQVCRSVRLFVRRKTNEVSSLTDLIALTQTAALVQMFRALKGYDDGRDDIGQMAEATALRWMTEREHVIHPPVNMPVQVLTDGGIAQGVGDDLVSY